ncbi:tyrosine-type recombinase/integrase [Pararhizobium haloflavum]|uniref:tyrosine-type recombinase/integrase n=1 Tax=Pararhizobium haloflavum TaxID=2037914 RepID=UPI000C18F3E6|nr:integrase arm-type DNA-binding domain-containing protein [Pararhizobium haloflavum]
MLLRQGLEEMAISELAIRKAKGRDKPYRISDEKGLYAIVRPNGAVWWRYDYGVGGKRKTLSLGTYPKVKLREARDARDAAAELVGKGIDPSEVRKREADETEAVVRNTFGALADEYIERLKAEGRTEKTLAKNSWYLKRLAIDLNDKPITQVSAADILATIRHVEASGRIDTAHRVRSAISAVFRMAVSTLRADTDPTFALKGALRSNISTPQAAITDEAKFGGLLRSVDEYDGWVTLRAALQIMALCYPRRPSNFGRRNGRTSILTERNG